MRSLTLGPLFIGLALPLLLSCHVSKTAAQSTQDGGATTTPIDGAAGLNPPVLDPSVADASNAAAAPLPPPSDAVDSEPEDFDTHCDPAPDLAVASVTASPKGRQSQPGIRARTVWTRAPGSGYGFHHGKLEITQPNEHTLHFSLDAWSGGHYDNINGKAIRRGASFLFRECRMAHDCAEPASCKLTFVPIGGDFRVEQDGECLGPSAVTFDGRYCRHVQRIRPSFDCRTTHYQVEKLICSDAVLADLDRYLGRVYRAQRKASQDREALVSSQHQWLARRNECSVDGVLRGDLGETAQRLESLRAEGLLRLRPGREAEDERGVRCLIRKYLSRIEVLNGADASRGDDLPKLYSTLRSQADRPSNVDGLEEPKVGGVLRVLLGPRFYDLIHSGGLWNADVEQEYVVVWGGPRGLFTVMEAFAAFGPSGDIWAAILEPGKAKDDPSHIDLFSWMKTRDGLPPAPFDDWRNRFAEVPVIRHDLGTTPPNPSR